MIGGGGGQTQPSTFSQGGKPAAYIPMAQGTADTNYQNLLGALYNPSMAALQNLPGLPAAMAWPQVQQAVGNITQNPWAAAAQSPYQWLTQIAGNLGQGQMAMGSGIAARVPELISAAESVWNTANDPQKMLYNQLVQEQSDKANAQNAMSGLSGTPYGADLVDNSLESLALNWQNQQLGRQSQGLQGLTRGLLGAGSLAGTGAQLQNQGVNTVASLSALPYQGYNAMQNANLGALSQMINLGNQQLAPAEDVLNYLSNYLQLGRQASQLAGSLGAQGFRQGQVGLGNTLGMAGLGSNLLFGNQGPFGAGGLFGSFGGGSMPDFSGLAGATAGGLFDFGASSLPFDVGTGAGLSDLLLPFAFL